MTFDPRTLTPETAVMLPADFFVEQIHFTPHDDDFIRHIEAVHRRCLAMLFAPAPVLGLSTQPKRKLLPFRGVKHESV